MDTPIIYINGLCDSSYYGIEFEYHPLNPSISDNEYYIGKCPSSIWGISFSSNYFNGLLDEFIMSNGINNYRNDRDGDGMSEGYEIIRSINSDQYNSMIHNYRIGLLFAPYFSAKEHQYVFDITSMRYYLISNGWNDNDIIFSTLAIEDPPSVAKWLDGYWIDGDPRMDSIGYTFDALEFGGPTNFYEPDFTQTTNRDDRFFVLPKLSDNDLLFTELRNHGVGYKDNPLPNGQGTNQEKDFGWRHGRCESVINDGSATGAEEMDGRGDFTESEFVVDIMHYALATWFPGDTIGAPTGDPYDCDPDFYTHTDHYTTGTNPKKNVVYLNLDGDDKLEELYLVEEYTIPEPMPEDFFTNPAYRYKGTNKYWIRLYIDGYDFDDPDNSLWDAQCFFYEGNPTTYNPTRLELKGVDLYEDDIENNYWKNSFTTDYISNLNDWIDVDEGFVTYCDWNRDTPIKESSATSTIDAYYKSYQYLGIWYDDDIRDNITRLNYKDIIFLFDFCYSGGLVNDLSEYSSLIMTSTIETDTSERYNTMFYSRIRGDNIAKYFQNGQYDFEDRSNGANPGRYDDLSAVLHNYSSFSTECLKFC